MIEGLDKIAKDDVLLEVSDLKKYFPIQSGRCAAALAR